MSTEDSLKNDVKKHIEKYFENKRIVKYAVRKCDSFTDSLNYVSEILFVDVDVENLGEVKKLHFFIKVAKKEKECRELSDIKKKYETEMFACEYIIPQFVEFQRQKNILNLFKSYPHYYTSSNEDFKEMVILENLLERGFQISNKLMALDYDHSLLVIKELAKMHAISFAIRDQKPHIFNEISNNVTDIEFHGKLAEFMKMFVEKFYPMFINALRFGNHMDISEKLIQVKDTILDKAKTLVNDKSAEPYTVINHGDVWITNLLFKYNELFRPMEVCIVDFQGVKLCSPVSDISQLIFTSVSTETRKAHYDHLIREYYRTFEVFLLELGSDPKKLFPYHVLQSHLKKYSLLGLTLSMKLIAGVSISTKESPKYESEEDKSKITEMFYNANRDSDLFNKKVSALILDYFMFGYDL